MCIKAVHFFAGSRLATWIVAQNDLFLGNRRYEIQAHGIKQLGDSRETVSGQVVGSMYQRVCSPFRVKRWIIRSVVGRFRLYQRIWFDTGTLSFSPFGSATQIARDAESSVRIWIEHTGCFKEASIVSQAHDRRHPHAF